MAQERAGTGCITGTPMSCSSMSMIPRVRHPEPSMEIPSALEQLIKALLVWA